MRFGNIFLCLFLAGNACAATLSVSRSTSGTPIDLNFFGPDDFAHWGRLDTSSFDHKDGANIISNLTVIPGPTGTLQQYTTDPVSFTWSGGTPTASATNSSTGLVVNRINDPNPGGGFSFTVAASTTLQTLRVWVGVFEDVGQLDVSLSDDSAPAITDTSFQTGARLGTTVFTIQFAANSDNQQLNVKWTAVNGTGSPTIQSAALASTPIAPQTRVALIGDETTAGTNISSPSLAYPTQLGTLLGNTYSVANFGATGATILGPGFGDAPFIASPAYADSNVFAPAIVVIFLGTSDSKPQNWANKAQFAADARSLIEHYAGLASHPQVFLALPPPAYKPENFDVNADTIQNEIVPVLRGLAADTNTALIDIFSALSAHPEFFPDNVHPNQDGHAVIAGRIFSVLQLAAPSGLIAAGVSSSEIDLSWTDNSPNEETFVLERSADAQTWTLIAQIPANQTSYHDTGLLAATTYFYRVRARNAAGESARSHAASGTTFSGERTNPEPVAGDTDGDGFSDALEIAAGTSPTNPADTPTGAPAGTPLSLADVGLAIKLNFAKAHQDSISLSGTLLLPAGFNVAGQNLIVDVGGVARAFTLDAHGRAKNGLGSASVKSKGSAARSAKFAVKMNKGDFAATLAGAGLTNTTVTTNVNIAVSVVFAGSLYETTQPQAYKAIAGKIGVTKDKR